MCFAFVPTLTTRDEPSTFRSLIMVTAPLFTSVNSDLNCGHRGRAAVTRSLNA